MIESAEPTADGIIGDLVISTIRIPGLSPTKQLTVGPLLSEKDFELIDVRVREIHKRIQSAQRATQLRALFDEALFYRSPPATNRQKILELLSDALVRQHAVPADFLDQVLERENLSGTAFNDIVAIPHTLGMPARQTLIVVAAFDEPVDWAGVPVRLVLLIAFSAADRNLFRDTFDHLVTTLAEPAHVRRLIKESYSAADFVKTLGQLMEGE